MFGRRRRVQPEPPGQDAVEPADQAAISGPYDAAAAPEDGRMRLNLGSLLLPVPEGAQLQVEVDKSGPVRAVHLMTGLGQITVTAFAAPRSGGLWTEVAKELVSRLRTDGAPVTRVKGEWGEEIDAVTPQGVLRFLAVDGPRWMLRGVAVGSAEHAEARAALLRDVVREAVVVRGPEPLPVRSPLPLQLPGPLAAQLTQAAAAGRDDPGVESARGTTGRS
ncbi:MAG: DUF3710 domain-containing protein [Pseudonocardiaceae bacterium]